MTNPECKKCGLLKSTVESDGFRMPDIVEMCKTGHDFGESIPTSLTEGILAEFDEKFPKIMGKNKVHNFPSSAFHDLKSFLLSTLEAGKKQGAREVLEGVRRHVAWTQEFDNNFTTKEEKLVEGINRERSRLRTLIEDSLKKLV